ncbi:Carotenoid ester lipase precursor [Mycena kentingensis (nom. inval.)]|nr:Carotenoid ester lipase precursor [Mycena kentingensis (nom. inval.)]
MRSILLLSSFTAALAAEPVVKLQYGSFRGAADGNLSTFLGIPFSAPAKRFSLPTAPTPFAGVRDALEYGPACPQQKLSGTGSPAVYNSTSEDCLTLNVFVPQHAHSKSKLPVLFWIYGGGFEFGYAADTDPRPTVERSILNGQPMIVVTPKYRVSAFGFLGGKELKDAGVGNLSLQDPTEIFAMEWVQKHISAFGGDPRQVVMGGVAAGAISAAMLLLDNKRFKQTDLYSGVFMVSGSPIPSPDIAAPAPQATYDTLVLANNCTSAADTLDCLRNVPLDAFLASVNDNIPDIFSYASLNLAFRPWTDGEVISREPLLSVVGKKYARVPFISGDADDEGTIFAFSTTNITTDAEFNGYIKSQFFFDFTSDEIAKVATLYPQDPAQGAPFDTGSANAISP